MRYYISDLHFFHRNLNHRMDRRGFNSVKEMNEYMIQQWNSKVRQNDEVVFLGDLSWGKPEETNAILQRLNGRLFWILGNHDRRMVKNSRLNADRFIWIKDYEELHDNGRKVVLCHYPVFCYPGQYRVDEQGNPKVYMLHGHVHDTHDARLVERFQKITRNTLIQSYGEKEPKSIPCNMINCFCMYSDYVPLTLDEWIELDRKRRENGNYTD